MAAVSLPVAPEEQGPYREHCWIALNHSTVRTIIQFTITVRRTGRLHYTRRYAEPRSSTDHAAAGFETAAREDSKLVRTPETGIRGSSGVSSDSRTARQVDPLFFPAPGACRSRTLDRDCQRVCDRREQRSSTHRRFVRPSAPWATTGGQAKARPEASSAGAAERRTPPPPR